MSLKRELIIIPATITDKSDDDFSQKRTAAYCRVSTDHEEQMTSYENQLEYYKEKIIRNPEWEFAGIFADEGITGTQFGKFAELHRVKRRRPRNRSRRPVVLGLVAGRVVVSGETMN